MVYIKKKMMNTKKKKNSMIYDISHIKKKEGFKLFDKLF